MAGNNNDNPNARTQMNDDQDAVGAVSRTRTLKGAWLYIASALTLVSVFVAVNQIFNFGFFVDYVIFDSRYLYLVLSFMLPLVFIYFPGSKRAPRDTVPWYDVALALFVSALSFYCTFWAEDIAFKGWEYNAPEHGIWAALAFWLTILEVARRTGGVAIFLIVLVFSLYPLYAESLPTVISGIGMDWQGAATFHIYSSESMLGIPMRAFALLVFGFVLFGVTLQFTGAGKFFINLAFALMGRFRGGPAKVAIFSSGLMGSMSGGPVTNVLTTGPMSIPAMRKCGFSRDYAAGVEACASTGGVLMPPVMGATAFVMANFLGINYSTILIAAIIPSMLYFFGLFMQIDAYSAKNQLQGMAKADLPRVSQTLKDGWYFSFVFILLIWMLVVLQRESTAPFYATALLLIINQFTKNKITLTGLKYLMAAAGALLAELAGVLAAIGLLVGALSSTGLSATLANDLIFLAGENVFLLLMMGALTSFILGIGMTVTAAYIFLALILVPALTRSGLDPLASHMFVMYWGMLSFITPPVALAAFAAASVAKGSPMKAGFQAMRLATVIYFIPFFFVFNPALLLNGSLGEILTVLVSAFLGVTLISAALQGYLIGLGNLGRDLTGLMARTGLFSAGIALALPGGGLVGVSHSTLIMIAVALLVFSALCILIRCRIFGYSLKPGAAAQAS